MSGIVGTSNIRSKIVGKSIDTIKAFAQWSHSGTTVTVNHSFGISSITDLTAAAGRATVNFSSTMSQAQYAVGGSASDGASSLGAVMPITRAVGSLIIGTCYVNGTDKDFPDNSILIFE